MKKSLLLFVALLAASAFADRLTFSDRFRMVTPSDPQFSPDGRSIAFVLSRTNLKENRTDSDIDLLDVASGAIRPLTFERRGIAQPRWSPDGSQIAFLANASAEKEGKRQIWVLPIRGGDARRVTEAAQSVQQFAWSPDGTTFAYVTSDEPEKKSDLDKFNKAFEVSDDDFLIREAPMSSHVWTIAANGGTPKRITSGAWSLPIAHPPGAVPSPVMWSPDGRTLIIGQLANPHSSAGQTSRIAAVDVATGAVRRITKAEVSESHPMFSPDGQNVVYMHPLGGERMNETRIWIAPIGGGAGHNVTAAIDRNLARAIWMPDGKSLLVGGHDALSTSYWIQPIDGSAARKLDLGDVDPWNGFWIDATVSKSGAVAFTGTTPMHPRELYLMDSPDAKPRAVTNFNDWIASKQLGHVEAVTWKNDGFDEDGVLITPPDFDRTKKYPLVVYIHGGPRASTTSGFAWLPQLFAAQNWVVFQPNYRGSDNLGNAYTHAIVGDSGAGPGRDVMAGIKEVEKRGFVDETRIAVGGWSYGGYMTSWMIGHYPIFKAAVAGAAVNNLIDQYTLGDANVARAYAMGGSPYVGDNMKKYIDQSPITYASRIKTPTLILSDMGDVRVPVTQSFQMYHALKDNNVPVKFIAYPVSGHSPEDPAHQSDIDHRYVEWFSQYLK